MAKVLIDIPKIEDFDYFKQTNICRANMCRAIKNGIVLDGLTNGEVMQKMFPNIKIGDTFDNGRGLYIALGRKNLMTVPMDWWNRKWGE